MINKYIAKRYWKDHSTPMGKTNELTKAYDDLINLSLGDPDLITNDIIIDNAMMDAKKGYTRYANTLGDEELREEICRFYKDEFKMDINCDEIFITTGGTLGMYLTLETIIDDGDEVIIPMPCYTAYTQQVELVRGIPVALFTYEDEDFKIDIKRLKSLITERTRAIIINTPNNPTGACMSKEELGEIAKIAEEYDLLIIADDIYGAYSYETPFFPIVSLKGMKKRVITLNSFSKDYTMTGWRIGSIIAPKDIIKTIQQINENVVFTSPAIAQRGAIYALKNRKEIQLPMVAEYKKRVMYAAERINKIPQFSVLKPKGTFYLYFNISKTGLNSVEASDVILKQAHVLTIPGTSFATGPCGDNYIRIACTVSTEKLEEAFNRIEKIQWD